MAPMKKTPMKSTPNAAVESQADGGDNHGAEATKVMKAMKAMKAEPKEPMKVMKTTSKAQEAKEKGKAKAKAKGARASFPDVGQLALRDNDGLAEGEEEEEAEDEGTNDLADGETDRRKCSRAQMYVFKKFFSQLPQEIQNKWNTLIAPGGAPGKQLAKNELVNACVPRHAGFGSELDIKEQTLKTTLNINNTQEAKLQQLGQTYTDMENIYGLELFKKGYTNLRSLYLGHRGVSSGVSGKSNQQLHCLLVLLVILLALFSALLGVERGDFWQDPGDGLYYKKSNLKTVCNSYSESQNLQKTQEV